MIPEPKTHASGEKKILGEALSAIREEIRDSESGMANPASVGRFRTPTGNSGIHENFVRAAVVLADRGQRLPRSSLRVSDLFRGCAGRPKPGSFGDSFWVGPGHALSEHGPCLVGGTVTLDDLSFIDRFAKRSGGDVTQVRGGL